MSVTVAAFPSFITFVSSLTLSFWSELASVSSFELLSYFWTVPVSSFEALELAVPPAADDPEELPVPMVLPLDSVELAPLDPIEPPDELLEPLVPGAVLLGSEDPALVPDCACADGAAA